MRNARVASRLAAAASRSRHEIWIFITEAQDRRGSMPTSGTSSVITSASSSTLRGRQVASHADEPLRACAGRSPHAAESRRHTPATRAARPPGCRSAASSVSANSSQKKCTLPFVAARPPAGRGGAARPRASWAGAGQRAARRKPIIRSTSLATRRGVVTAQSVEPRHGGHTTQRPAAEAAMEPGPQRHAMPVSPARCWPLPALSRASIHIRRGTRSCRPCTRAQIHDLGQLRPAPRIGLIAAAGEPPAGARWPGPASYPLRSAWPCSWGTSCHRRGATCGTGPCPCTSPPPRPRRRCRQSGTPSRSAAAAFRHDPQCCIHRRGSDDLAGVQDALRIEGPLHLLKERVALIAHHHADRPPRSRPSPCSPLKEPRYFLTSRATSVATLRNICRPSGDRKSKSGRRCNSPAPAWA